MTLSLIPSAVNTSVANGCSISPSREVGIQKAEGGESRILPPKGLWLSDF